MIHPDPLRFVHPARWKYDVLRCLDGFAAAGVPWDEGRRRVDSGCPTGEDAGHFTQLR